MKVAKTVALLAVVTVMGSAQPVQSQNNNFQNVLQNVAGNLRGFGDLDSRKLQIDTQISTALSGGQISPQEATEFRAELNRINNEVTQARTGGRRLSFTQSLRFTNDLNVLSGRIDQAREHQTATLPSIDASATELVQRINTSLAANKITQQEATQLRNDLQHVAEIEAAFKADGNGVLTPRQIRIVSGEIDKVHAKLDEFVRLADSAVPELTQRRTAIESRINTNQVAGKLSAAEVTDFMGELNDIATMQQSFLVSGGTLNGSEILQLAGRFDRLEDRIETRLASAVLTPPVTPPVTTVPVNPPVNTYPINEPTAANRYRDTQGYWGDPYVSELAARSIIGGFPDGTFRPNDNITRAQFAAIAAKALNLPSGGGGANFVDVPAKHWAVNAIAAASNAGLVGGFPDGTFGPEQNLTRAQALVILAKALRNNPGESPAGLAAYADRAAVPTWAEPSIAKAANARIIVSFPDSTSIRPNALATRGEVAALMYQTLSSNGAGLPRVSIGVLTGGPVIGGGTQPPVNTTPVVETLTISQVRVTPRGALGAGETVTVSVSGTPGASGNFTIAGLSPLPLREISPGVYEGTYTVKKTDSFARSRVTAQLTKPGAQPVIGESNMQVSMDAVAPIVDNVRPRRDGTIGTRTPNIVVDFSDGTGSGIDRRSVRLIVNGTDVTSQAQIDQNGINYRPTAPIAVDIVNAEVQLSDRAGNPTTYKWTFDVNPRMQAGGQGNQ